jgi:hypothetical protein
MIENDSANTRKEQGISMTNPAVEVAKEKRDGESGIHILSTGVSVRLVNVSSATISEIVEKITYPEVPVYHNERKGRDEPNPLDPAYINAVEQTGLERGNALMDAVVLFGVELVDGLPDADKWLKKLRLLARRGHLDLSEFDLEDEIDLEFLYKKHFAIGTSDWSDLMRLSGISQDAIDKAAESFQGDT